MKIICPKHGHIIPLHTCSHIREQVQTCSCCIAEKDFKILTIRYEWMTPVNDDEKSEDTMNCFDSHVFCNDCIEKYDLPVDISISSDDIDGKYKLAFKDVGVMCSKCFSTLIQT